MSILEEEDEDSTTVEQPLITANLSTKDVIRDGKDEDHFYNEKTEMNADEEALGSSLESKAHVRPSVMKSKRHHFVSHFHFQFDLELDGMTGNQPSNKFVRAINKPMRNSIFVSIVVLFLYSDNLFMFVI